MPRRPHNGCDDGLYGHALREGRLMLPSEWRDQQEILAWEAANPELVAQLDAVVGRRVALRPRKHPYLTLAADLPSPVRRCEGPSGETYVVPESYPPGKPFRVIARLRDRLVGRDACGHNYLLKPEWLVAIPEPEPTSKTRAKAS